MRLSQEQAVRRILQAKEPSDLFEGHPSRDAYLEDAYRSLTMLIQALDLRRPEPGQPLPNPEMWELYSILIGFYHRWSQSVIPAFHRHEDPYFFHRPLVGSFGVYQPRVFVHENHFVTTLTTDTPGGRITVLRGPSSGLPQEHRVGTEFGPVATSHRLPTLDQGVRNQRWWYTYQVPSGMQSLREILATEPNGLSPRDWTWIVLQIVQTVHDASRHCAITADTLLIDRAQRCIALTEWWGEVWPHPRMGLPYAPDIRAVALLSQLALRDPAGRPLLEFIEAHRDDPVFRFKWDYCEFLGLSSS